MKYLLIFLLTSGAHAIYAQGCSDAGFCTMGAMKPDQHYNKKIQIKLRSVELTHYAGFTRFGDIIYNYVADFNIGINHKNAAQIKLPYVNVDGTLADTHGVGDMSVSFTHNLVNREGFEVNATLGSKIPLGNYNLRSPEGRPLPMYNQPGLGTCDIVAGMSIITSNWLLATGLQHPFGEVSSTFIWADWKGHPLEEKAREYTQSRLLKRGTDMMLRVEKNFRFTNFNFGAGLLNIYRVNKDIIRMPGGVENGKQLSDKKIVQSGSEGLAVTLLLIGGYQFNTKLSIKVIQGFRLIKREKTADGLSREFVNNISLLYRF